MMLIASTVSSDERSCCAWVMTRAAFTLDNHDITSLGQQTSQYCGQRTVHHMYTLTEYIHVLHPNVESSTKLWMHITDDSKVTTNCTCTCTSCIQYLHTVHIYHTYTVYVCVHTCTEDTCAFTHIHCTHCTLCYHDHIPYSTCTWTVQLYILWVLVFLSIWNLSWFLVHQRVIVNPVIAYDTTDSARNVAYMYVYIHASGWWQWGDVGGARTHTLYMRCHCSSVLCAQYSTHTHQFNDHTH